MEKEELLQVYRHSLAHILAKAVIEIYGKEVQYGIGPQIEDGCYYDFVLPEGKSIGEEDFKAIENKMREIIKRREPWTRKEVSKAEAKEIGAICENNENAIDFMGKSSIADIPDLARGAALVAGNDTGPSHIAHIAGAKTVMLFTDYDYGRAAPKGKANVIALHGAKIDDIPVAAVVDSLEELCSRSTLSS